MYFEHGVALTQSNLYMHLNIEKCDSNDFSVCPVLTTCVFNMNSAVQYYFDCITWKKKKHGILYQYMDLSVNTNEWKLMLD